MGKKTLRAINPAETEILRFVRKLKQATVQQICDVLPPRRNIAYKTVLTLPGRLGAKG